MLPPNWMVLIVPLWNWNSALSYDFVELSGVLIVPLWNWNNSTNSNYRIRYNSINCTVVELKQGFGKWIRIRQIVLIVPLWNWNIILWNSLKSFHRVLIVPLWNWNMDTFIWWWWRQCINCTVVELKRECKNFLDKASLVLIVPLWNWNYTRLEDIYVATDCINCTVVELKLQPNQTQ